LKVANKIDAIITEKEHIKMSLARKIFRSHSLRKVYQNFTRQLFASKTSTSQKSLEHPRIEYVGQVFTSVKEAPFFAEKYHNKVNGDAVHPITREPEIIVVDLKPKFEPIKDSYLLGALSAKADIENLKYRHVGFRYIPNVITPEEEIDVMETFKRYVRTQHCSYSKGHFVQRERTPIIVPDSVKKVVSLFAKNRVVGLPSFNYYLPHQTFPAHIDNIFHCQQIAILSLHSPTVLKFKCWENPNKGFEVCLMPRSLYILSEECRFNMTHEISPNEVEEFQGIKFPRQERLSLAFPIDPMLPDLPIGVFGESNQRNFVDKHFMESGESKTRLTLDQYLTFVENYCSHNFQGSWSQLEPCIREVRSIMGIEKISPHPDHKFENGSV
jgi:alkylated DNA repair dioxygenase AlkB